MAAASSSTDWRMAPISEAARATAPRISSASILGSLALRETAVATSSGTRGPSAKPRDAIVPVSLVVEDMRDRAFIEVSLDQRPQGSNRFAGIMTLGAQENERPLRSFGRHYL